MAKIQRSLIGREAHGVLAKNLLLRTHGRKIIVGALTSSTNPRTPAQIAHRSIFQGGIEYWHTLTDEEKAAYTSINPKVGYNPAYLNFMGTWLMGTVPDHHEDHELGGSGQVSLAGLSGLLADQQVAFRLRTGVDADKPAAGNTEGDVWWATDTDKLYLWDGAAWAQVGAVPAPPGEGHITILPLAYVSIGQGNWIPLDYPTGWSAWPLYNASNADGDELDFQIYLAPGTYTIIVVTDTGPARGIIDIDIDGGEVASFDLYDVGWTTNVRNVDTGNVINTSGLKTLTLRVDGKHASSTDHFIILHSISLFRTA